VVKLKAREITKRSNGWSKEYRLMKLRQIIIEWTDYYGIADMKQLAKALDEWIRRRIRMCFWKQWKKIKIGTTILESLELRTTAYLEKIGYTSIYKRYKLVH